VLLEQVLKVPVYFPDDLHTILLGHDEDLVTDLQRERER
jgi:hypothetical protein